MKICIMEKSEILHLNGITEIPHCIIIRDHEELERSVITLKPAL